MYSTKKEEKPAVAEKFIRTLKNKISNNTVSKKSVSIDKLDDIVSKYNNAYHRTTKVKPIDVKISTCIGFEFENNDKDSKFMFI